MFIHALLSVSSFDNSQLKKIQQTLSRPTMFVKVTAESREVRWTVHQINSARRDIVHRFNIYKNKSAMDKVRRRLNPQNFRILEVQFCQCPPTFGRFWQIWLQQTPVGARWSPPRIKSAAKETLAASIMKRSIYHTVAHAKIGNISLFWGIFTSRDFEIQK